MKNFQKLTFILVAVSFCSVIFSGCKKDDAKSPGYFKVDGKEYDLERAYYQYNSMVEHDNSAGHNEFLDHNVSFVGSGITIKNQEEGIGKGAVVEIEFMDPLKLQTPASGNYMFQLGVWESNLPVKSNTYSWFEMAYGDVQSEMEIDYKITASALQISNSGGIYEFSSSGVTEEGKAFEFYYKGSILPVPAN